MEECQENSIEENTSMEELKMEEDENVKESSMEDDILGAQSLFLSESDDGDDIIFKNKKYINEKSVPKRIKRILDSDGEEDGNNQHLTAVEEKFPPNKKKTSSLFDYDNDNKKNGSTEEKPLNKLSVEIDVDVHGVGKVEFSRLDKVKGKYKKRREERKSSLQESSSDSEIDNYSSIEDKIKATKTNLSLVDSDSSDTESIKEINIYDLEASAGAANNEEIQNKKSKVVRASAKKAMDEMHAIQSEQQRLHREAQISIPYHKARKHTLDEFLKRRTIIQPQIDCPAGIIIQERNLKMTPEELEKYAYLMEERAKEATEFFKSESENEEEQIFKNNEGVLDNYTERTTQNDFNTCNQSNEITNEESVDDHNNISDMLTKNLDGIQLTKEHLTELLTDREHLPALEEGHERPTSSKVLITEIIELPKLDMNTVRISPIKKESPRLSLNIMQLLVEKNLTESPSLRGDPNKLIDLETGNLIDKKPTGMENLMKRLMLSVKARKSKKSETCNILSLENGKIEMSNVNITRTETNDVSNDSKPGAAYFELKKNLKEIIKKKRLEDINKKQEEEVEYNKCLANGIDETEDEVEDMYPKEKVLMVDEEENALLVEDVCDGESDGDNEDFKINVDDEDGNSNADDGECSEEHVENDINVEYVDKSQRKSRIIKAFNDTDEEECENDDIDFLKTQPPIIQPSLCESESSVKAFLEDEENELLTLCSGTFGETQKTPINALMSQIPITQNIGKPTNDEELMELCSGTFDELSKTVQPTQSEGILKNSMINRNTIISSDEENEEEQLSKKGKRVQIIKKCRKKKAKLMLSDDEYEEEEEECEYDKQMERLDDNFEIAAEESETFVDYDSEENEILVRMTKKDKEKHAKNFFENEAELSESDWGSADEDENNLDRYDIELGDEDQFDREKLQIELGQIHARKMLDEDIRKVRKIQEILFEDEEKDGVGRQRSFKWKNAESGFSLDDRRTLDENGDGKNGDSGDEINEHQWRKIRYEREQFLKENRFNPYSQDMSTALHSKSIQINNTTASAAIKKKLQIITTKKPALSTSNSKKASSSFLISKGISAMHKKSVRGSFLVRDKEILNKLAGLAKGTTSSVGVSDMDDTAGTVSIKSIKPKNFVFATLTEEEHENLKRKADDLLNSSNENGKNFMKKPKMEPRRNKCFIDQLL